MQIFGLDPIQAALVITAIGVALQVTLGILKQPKGTPVEVRQIATSVIISAVVTLTAVTTTLQAMPENVDGLALLLVLIQMIGSVAGIDTLVKNGVKAASKVNVK